MSGDIESERVDHNTAVVDAKIAGVGAAAENPGSERRKYSRKLFRRKFFSFSELCRGKCSGLCRGKCSIKILSFSR